jgi:hypothetical protein
MTIIMMCQGEVKRFGVKVVSMKHSIQMNQQGSNQNVSCGGGSSFLPHILQYVVCRWAPEMVVDPVPHILSSRVDYSSNSVHYRPKKGRISYHCLDNRKPILTRRWKS